jgi:predicted pyridoxine 5'-phosphate oxidase superfamily flavin-nucleotide-binding protein
MNLISEKMKSFIETTNLAFVASANVAGIPHLAAGKGLQVPDPRHIILTAWFCSRTLENLAGNPAVALIVTDPATATGYQFVGEVEKTSDAGILDGYDPRSETPGLPQVLYRLVIRVDGILEFTHDAHSDRPLTSTS